MPTQPLDARIIEFMQSELGSHLRSYQPHGDTHFTALVATPFAYRGANFRPSRHFRFSDRVFIDLDSFELS